jgi:hypothetical protein
MGIIGIAGIFMIVLICMGIVLIPEILFILTRLVPAVSLSLLIPGCMSLALQSTWLSGGGGAEPERWRESLFSLGERVASLAVQNDDRFLHVAFITTDPGLQERILKQGIFIWFDPNGGEARRFGIRYPLAWGTMPGSIDDAPHSAGELRGAGKGKPGDDLEIYTDGYKEYERVGKKDAGGIGVNVEILSDTLLCRIRVPLRGPAGGPYALGAAPGDLIGVGVETRANRPTGESIGTLLPFQVWRVIRLSARR